MSQTDLDPQKKWEIEYQHQCDLALKKAEICERWLADNRIENQRHQLEIGRRSFEATVRFAEQTLRGCFLVNGLGAVSLLTFAGNVAARKDLTGDFTVPFKFLIIGLVLSLLASLMAYFTQDRISALIIEQVNKDNDFKPKRLLSYILFFVAFFLGIGSVGCFVGAMFAAIDAITALKAPS